MSEDRKKLGYQDFSDKPYLVKMNEAADSTIEIVNLINNADVVIIGSSPEELVLERILSNKLTFLYSERWFKRRPWYFPDPRVWYSLYKNHIRYRKKNLYALAASAYFANDAYAFGAYKNKIFKWGYFPEVNGRVSFEQLYNNKGSNTTRLCSILWVGRFLDWKHPEAAIYVAKHLKNDGCNFILNIIGTGPLEDELKSLIAANKLEGHVHLLGPKTPTEVRTYMEKADVFLFTSDKNEGWGAVLNESMNSACAVVASKLIGSAPFLIDDGNNGLLFKSGDWEELYRKTKQLIDNDFFRKQLSSNAYGTITNLWNPRVAAERFNCLATAILEHRDFSLFKEGPCSMALPTI